jgi:cytoskeletal protein CcmA (bactofilin family)
MSNSENSGASGPPLKLKGVSRPGAGVSPPSQPAARPSEVKRRPTEVAPSPRRVERPAPIQSESRRLIVGRDISLNGEISSCDRLMVEGSVEASISDCREIEIAQTGHFKGTAEIDNADIAGHFEGSLTVRDRLLVRATGRVSGEVRYARLEVQSGGRIAGSIDELSGPTIAPLQDHREPVAAPARAPTRGPFQPG